MFLGMLTVLESESVERAKSSQRVKASHDAHWLKLTCTGSQAAWLEIRAISQEQDKFEYLSDVF